MNSSSSSTASLNRLLHWLLDVSVWVICPVVHAKRAQPAHMAMHATERSAAVPAEMSPARYARYAPTDKLHT